MTRSTRSALDVFVALLLGACGRPVDVADVGTDASTGLPSGQESGSTTGGFADASTTEVAMDDAHEPGSSSGSDTSDTTESCELPFDAPISLVWELLVDSGMATDDVAGPVGLYPSDELLVVGEGSEPWLLRIDPSGNPSWKVPMAAPPQTAASVVAIGPGDMAFAVGSTITQDERFGLTSTLYVGAFDGAGIPAWADDTPTHPPNPTAQGWAAAATPDGGVVVGGLAGDAGGYLRRYDAGGRTAWTVQTDIRPRALAIDETDIYVAGTDGTVPLLERRDATGSVVWSQPGPGPGDPNFFEGGGEAVALGPEGHPVFVGLSSFGVGSPGMPTESWLTFWVQRRDLDGNEVWTTELDHVDYAQLSLGVHADGEVTTVTRTKSNRPRVRHFGVEGVPQWDYEVPCIEGSHSALVDDDLVLTGRMTDAMHASAFVGRFRVE